MTDPILLTRRQLVVLAAVTAAAPGLLGAAAARADAPKSGSALGIADADGALAELMAGNGRFVKGKPVNPRRTPADFRGVAAAQHPIAVIVSCADSRVPPELIFDVGVGDVFIVRVAGNVIQGAGAAVKGSIEYAIAELSVPLVMVLGHTSCGAVKAALQHIDAKDSLPGAINDLVELVKPAVTKSRGEPGDPLENAIRENVILGVQRLQALEPILAPRVADGRVKLVGGVYDLKTGRVTLVDVPR